MPYRRRLAAALVLVALLVAAAVGWRLALQRLHAAVEGALGPRAHVAAIDLGWSGVVLRDLRIAGDGKSWPAPDELRAREVRIAPDLRSVFGAGWRVHRIEVDGAYLSLLRSREGRLRMLPSLLEQPAAAPHGTAASAPSLRIGEVRLRDASIDFYDASIRARPHRMQLQKLQAELGPLQLPALDVPVQLDVAGVFKGPQRDGRLTVDGRVTPATRDAQLNARLAGADLVALQPYLLKLNEGGVRRGALDLKLDASVARNRLKAPGTVVLSGLELAPGEGLLSTFAGVPRQAVLAAMSRDGRIEVSFALEGRLDDPRFSLNENFATRLATGMAESLGVSVAGVVEGVGSVIKGLFGR